MIVGDGFGCANRGVEIIDSGRQPLQFRVTDDGAVLIDTRESVGKLIEI
jgi:hypothetical protein